MVIQEANPEQFGKTLPARRPWRSSRIASRSRRPCRPDFGWWTAEIYRRPQKWPRNFTPRPLTCPSWPSRSNQSNSNQLSSLHFYLHAWLWFFSDLSFLRNVSIHWRPEYVFSAWRTIRKIRRWSIKSTSQRLPKVEMLR